MSKVQRSGRSVTVIKAGELKVGDTVNLSAPAPKDRRTRAQLLGELAEAQSELSLERHLRRTTVGKLQTQLEKMALSVRGIARETSSTELMLALSFIIKDHQFSDPNVAQ